MKPNVKNWGMWLTVVLLMGAVWSAAGASKIRLKPQKLTSYRDLQFLLQAHQTSYLRYGSSLQPSTPLALPPTALLPTATPSSTSAGSPSPVSSVNSSDYSSTVIQVAGVDEGDQVKTDGHIICQINQNRVFVLLPGTTPSLASTLDYTTNQFYPSELYLLNSRLVVVGTAYETPALPYGIFRLLPYYASSSTVVAKIYNVSDPAHPIKVRELQLDGDEVSSRLIGTSLYLVAREYPYYYTFLPMAGINSALRMNQVTTQNPQVMLPSYRDSKSHGGQTSYVPLSQISYFNGFDLPDYLVVGGVDLLNPTSTLSVSAVLGAGDQVYCSPNNLYVTASRPMDIYFAPLESGAPIAVDPLPPVQFGGWSELTDIYKFALSGGQSQFLAANTVTGTVASAYFMDEYNGYLRVATTQHQWWSPDGNSHNHLTVMDSSLNPVGSLNDFAPGEQLYASRFLDNRAFLVTYQQIDPLFAIDLSNPAKPVAVGQLTLPGYSTFLLPYDANHLIGFGKDVLIDTNTDTSGDVAWWDGSAFYQGLKLALFDVTDLHNPVQTDEVSIGDRGSDSPALYDPHAILFQPSRNLLAFPLNVAQVSNPDPTQPWQWGNDVFQGAYVYQVTTNGFTFQGSISQKPAGQNPDYTYGDEITRLVQIGDELYSLSSDWFMANRLDTLSEDGELALPAPPQYSYPIVW